MEMGGEEMQRYAHVHADQYSTVLMLKQYKLTQADVLRASQTTSSGSLREGRHGRIGVCIVVTVASAAILTLKPCLPASRKLPSCW